MSPTTFWIALAVICLVAEFFLPGAVLGFVGLAAAMVGLAGYSGWIEGWLPSLTWFFISSIFLVLVVRTFFLRLIPGESRIDNVDEDADTIGAIVEVIQDIKPSKRGRISFRDSSWDAESDDFIAKGEKAVIISRSGSLLIVQNMAKGDQRP